MARYSIGGVFGGAKGREKSIKDFKEMRLRGLTMHHRSGGVGHNFQNACNIFVPEFPQTARDFQQDVGRCYRSGQEHTVVVTVLVARKTIQETLLDRVFTKDAITRQIIDTDSILSEDLTSNVKKMTKKELYAALKGRTK
jgi:SNF2 family DNA or RNA helicase